MYEESTVRRLVKEIDLRFDCCFDFNREGYRITQKSPLGRVSLFDFIGYRDLQSDKGKAFFDRMRQTMYVNRNGDPLREVEENNDLLDRRQAEKQDEDTEYLVKSTAPRMYRALQET
jgi:hypothetical protein